jgi:hypothetical protein
MGDSERGGDELDTQRPSGEKSEQIRGSGAREQTKAPSIGGVNEIPPVEYPGKLKLWIIVLTLCLSLFLCGLVSATVALDLP